MLGPGCENYLGFHFGDRFQMMIHVFSLFIISYSDSHLLPFDVYEKDPFRLNFSTQTVQITQNV